MLKIGSLWAIYIASYFANYVLILGLLVWGKLTNMTGQFPQNMSAWDWTVWIVLLALIIFSFLVMKAIKRIRMTSRIKIEPKGNSVWKVYTGFLGPVLTLAATFFGDYGVAISLIIFFVAGIAFVKSRQVHFASVFIFPMRYNIYEGNECIIISRDTRDALRLKMLADGIQAKELARGIYLVQ